jgi:predicted enzyme related to lactoylglutathione lyase
MTDQFPADVPPYWMPYFAVADVDATAERAAVLGATVVLPPTDVPDGPRLSVLRDPQGAVFGVHVAGTEG